ncbi:MAG: hypothetical protein AVDCRST_MAG01-01-2943, partial [uncultured Rubrobacteraceae bacterium]
APRRLLGRGRSGRGAHSLRSLHGQERLEEERQRRRPGPDRDGGRGLRGRALPDVLRLRPPVLRRRGRRDGGRGPDLGAARGLRTVLPAL